MKPEEWKVEKIKGVLDAMNEADNVNSLEALAKNIIPVIIKGLPLEDIKYLRTMYLSRKQALIDEGKPYDDSHIKDEYRETVKKLSEKDSVVATGSQSETQNPRVAVAKQSHQNSSPLPPIKKDLYETGETKDTKAVEKDNQVGQVDK